MKIGGFCITPPFSRPLKNCLFRHSRVNGNPELFKITGFLLSQE